MGKLIGGLAALVLGVIGYVYSIVLFVSGMSWSWNGWREFFLMIKDCHLIIFPFPGFPLVLLPCNQFALDLTSTMLFINSSVLGAIGIIVLENYFRTKNKRVQPPSLPPTNNN